MNVEASAQIESVWDFILRKQRVPLLDEGEKPWTYHGWLLYYVQMLHATHPAVPDRWGYLLRTFSEGKLLDEPIPQIRFGEPDRQVRGILDQCCRLVGFDLGGWSDFRVFLEWLDFGLGVTRERARGLKEEMEEKLYRACNLKPMLVAPYDYLGAWISERHAPGWNPNRFHPTPHQVVECMVRMVNHDEEGKDRRALSVCDPCLGTGRMLLHASNFSLRLYGQDIDPLVVLAAKVNAALYAPWLAFPLPDSFFPGVRAVEPPPAPLPVPEEHQPEEGQTVYRVDDRGQLRLF